MDLPHTEFMKIAFISPRFFPYRGGQENYVLKLARHLRAQGHTVSVLTSNAFDLESFWVRGFRTVAPGHEDVGGVDVRRFPISYRKWVRRLGRLLGYVGDWRWKARYRAPGFCVQGLARAVREFKPDVVHIGPLPYTRLMYEGLREARHCGARVIATPCVHFGEDNSQEVARHYTRDYQIRLLSACDAVLTMTDMERRRLAEAGIDRDSMRSTAQGIDIAEVTGGNGVAFRRKWNLTGPVILHLGTKAEDKGTVTVVDALKILWEHGSEASLVLAGSSTSAFENYLGRQPRLPRLVNLGPIEEPEKRDILAATDILAHPSRVESLGIVYLEAWANAKPVIGADTAASREIIASGRDGLLVPFGDAKALASAVHQLLNDFAEREQMGRAGQEKVRAKYTWDVVLPGIVEAFLGTAPGSAVPTATMVAN